MLSSTTCRTQATGSDSTAIYNYGYRIKAASDLLVTVRNLTTNVESVLTLTTDYTVTGIGLASGSITLVSAGQAWIDPSGDLSANYLIVIRRVRPLQQNTSIRNQGTYYASVHEDEFDDLVMQTQQLDDYRQRALMLPETILASAFNPVLPSAVMASPPPGSVIQINSAGDGLTLGNPILGWTAVTIPYSSFNAAALTDQITAFALPAGFILLGLLMKHTVAFAGSGISDVYCDLGVSGTPDLFSTDFDVHQSVADSAFQSAFPFNVQSFANSTNIMIRATAVGANLSALTAGSINVYYWYMNLNGG